MIPLGRPQITDVATMLLRKTEKKCVLTVVKMFVIILASAVLVVMRIKNIWIIYNA